MENTNKKTYTLRATIRIEIESDLELDDAIDEFSAGCSYEFSDTDNCKIIKTEWEDTTL